MFGTKMRSVIKLADDAGVKAIVDQQFEVGRQILAAGLVPIIEPEVDIHSPQKAEAEALLKADILEQLGQLGAAQQVMLKLTLPDTDGFYADLVEHPNVLRVVALSGGYSRDDANARLASNHGRHRQLLPRTHRGPVRSAERRGVRRRARRVDRRHLQGVDHVTLQRGQPALRTTKPVRSFGVKNVDLGGISRPSRAVRVISATLTGRISTAATAVPFVTAATASSRPCW